MATLSVRLFGKFSAERNEQTIDGLDTRKLQDLFGYLALYRSRPHSRESVASLLWGNTSTAQSKAYLRKALWQLQEVLDAPGTPAEQHLLLVEPEWVQLNAKADLWLDVEVFERAFNAAQGISGDHITTECAQELQSAADLYRGDLLEGCYQDWCLYERERLQNMYIAILDKLMGYCEAHREYERGLIYGASILRYDRTREQTYRRLMRLHVLSGDRTGALREYRRCVATLLEELNVAPTSYTTALYEQIRANQFDGVSSGSLSQSAAQLSQASLAETLANLKRIETTAIQLYQQIQNSLQMIERAILARRK
jgi:DNA-binding SARP family transcriptional activator